MRLHSLAHSPSRLVALIHVCLLVALGSLTAHAATPGIINYQGRVQSNSVDFTGTGQFRFALVNGAGTQTLWSNDGSSTTGNQPTAAVSLTVTKGLYAVILGDTTLTNMTTIPTNVFSANSDVRLRVWFNDGNNGVQLLSPDQRITSVGYAMVAGSADSLTTPITLSGDVTGTSSASVVSSVGGVTAANVASGANAANAATTASTPSTIVLRDANGNIPGLSSTVTLTGDVTGSSAANTIAASTVTGKAITGFVSGAGAVTASDTILTSINKINGNDLLKAPLASPTFTGTVTAPTFAGNLTGNVNGNVSGSASSVTGVVAIANGGTGSATQNFVDLSTNQTGIAGNKTLTGVFNVSTAFTVEPRSSNTGAGNLFIGSGAGISNTTGGGNIALGTQALKSNTTSNNSIAIGFQALFNNTTASSNVATGTQSLYSNTTGYNNTAYGIYSLEFNTTGFTNTAFGTVSLLNVTTGSNNTGIGFGAGSNLTTGSNNIDIGHLGVAAESNTIRIGTPGTHTTTVLSGNVGIDTPTNPVHKLDVHSTNGAILAVGDTVNGGGGTGNPPYLYMFTDNTNAYSGLHERSGRDFVFLNTPNGTGVATEYMRIKAGGNVGIGTPTPNALLDLSSTVQTKERLRLSGNDYANSGNVPSGISFLLQRNLINRADLFIGQSAALTSNTTNGGIRIIPAGIQGGPQGDVNSIDAVSTDGTTIKDLVLNTTLRMVGSTGNVGIGTPSPAYKLDVTGATYPQMRIGVAPAAFAVKALNMGFNTALGTIGGGCIQPEEQSNFFRDLYLCPFDVINSHVAIGQTTAPSHLLTVNGICRSTSASFVTSSDRRVKEHIEPVSGSLDRLLKLRPVTFDYIAEFRTGRNGLDKQQTGFIAQEVQTVFPEMVSQNTEKVGSREIKDFHVLNTSNLTPHLVAAVQELKHRHDAEVKSLQSENATLKAQLEAQHKRLAELEVKDKAREARLARIEKALGDDEPKAVNTRFEAK